MNDQKIRIRDVASFARQSISDYVRNHPIKTGLKLAGVAAFVTLAGMSVQTANYEGQLYQQVKQAADVNRDGAVTSEEWAEVYKAMGKHYDARDPAPIFAEDMEK